MFRNITFDDWMIEDYVGTGKYCVVLRARDVHDRLVALKVLWEGSKDALEQAMRGKPPPPISASTTRQFRTEADILAQLNRFSEEQWQQCFVPQLYATQLEANPFQYLVMEFVEYPTVLDIIHQSEVQGNSPLIPELFALEAIHHFVMLCSRLHQDRRFLFDSQLRNFCLQLPDESTGTPFDFRIIDWNGTISFQDGLNNHGYDQAPSYDARYAMAFLFDMLTNGQANQQRTISRRGLRDIAGAHWEAISPGTRALVGAYLGKDAGKFNVNIDDLIQRLRTRIRRWEGGWRDIQPDPNQTADSDLEDGDWFASYAGDIVLQQEYAQLRRHGLIHQAGVFGNVISSMKTFLRAAKSTDLNAQQETIDLNDLYDYHHIRLIQQHYDYSVDTYEGYLTSAVGAVRQAMDAHTHEAFVEQEGRLARLVEETQATELPRPLIDFFETLCQELALRVIWTRPIASAEPYSLSDINVQPNLISPGWNDTMLEAVHLQLNHLENTINLWYPRPEFAILRKKVIYDMLGAYWEKDISEDNVAPEALLQDLRTVIDHQIRYSTQLRDHYDTIDQLLSKGRYIDAQAKIMEGMIRFNQDKWLVRQLRERINHLLTPSEWPDDAEIIQAFVQELPLIGPEQRKLLTDFSERVDSDQRAKTIVPRTNDAIDYNALVDRLEEAQTLGVLPQLDQTTRNTLAELDKAFRTYVDQRGAELPRSKTRRAQLLSRLHGTRRLLRTAKGQLRDQFAESAPKFSSQWLTMVEGQLERDLVRLEAKARLRHLLPRIAVIAVFVVAGIIVLFLAFSSWQERQEEEDANATATSQAITAVAEAIALETATAVEAAMQESATAEQLTATAVEWAFQQTALANQQTATAAEWAFQQTALAIELTGVYFAQLTETVVAQRATPTATAPPTPIRSPTATAEIPPAQATIFAQETLAAETEIFANATRTAAFALTATESAFAALQCRLVPINDDSQQRVRVLTEPKVVDGNPNAVGFIPDTGMIVAGRVVANHQNWWVVRVEEPIGAPCTNQDCYVLQDMEHLRFEGGNQYDCDLNRLPTMTPTYTPTETLTPTVTPSTTPTPTPSLTPTESPTEAAIPPGPWGP